MLYIILVNKNTKALLVYRKEIGLKVNAEKVKYVITYREQNAGQNHNIKIGNEDLKVCHSSNILKQPKQIKIAFVKKFRAERT